jgi:hypothetical protein
MHIKSITIKLLDCYVSFYCQCNLTINTLLKYDSIVLACLNAVKNVCSGGFRSAAIRCCVVGLVVPCVSKESTTFIFKSQGVHEVTM